MSEDIPINSYQHDFPSVSLIRMTPIGVPKMMGESSWGLKSIQRAIDN